MHIEHALLAIAGVILGIIAGVFNLISLGFLQSCEYHGRLLMEMSYIVPAIIFLCFHVFAYIAIRGQKEYKLLPVIMEGIILCSNCLVVSIAPSLFLRVEVKTIAEIIYVMVYALLLFADLLFPLFLLTFDVSSSIYRRRVSHRREPLRQEKNPVKRPRFIILFLAFLGLIICSLQFAVLQHNNSDSDQAAFDVDTDGLVEVQTVHISNGITEYFTLASDQRIMETREFSADELQVCTVRGFSLLSDTMNTLDQLHAYNDQGEEVLVSREISTICHAMQEINHHVLECRIFRVGDEWFASAMLNVNLWTPYRFYYFNRDSGRLILLYTFANTDIHAVRILSAEKLHALDQESIGSWYNSISPADRVSEESSPQHIPTGTLQENFWGSYTADKTFSYDHRFYAIQTIDDSTYNVRFILVTVYETATDQIAGSFLPARASDFYGICWERDTYNIWTQSADIGTYCYEYRDGGWVRNEALKPPAYIISKYDEQYRYNPELWDTVYKSPTE